MSPQIASPVDEYGLSFAFPASHLVRRNAKTIVVPNRPGGKPDHGLRAADSRRMATKRKRMNVYEAGDVTVMDLGTMDIWDGADLALIRDTLVLLIQRDGRRKIGVDMAHVKYIPSGYFGMLFDWKERGVEIYLLDPQPNVRKMLWFRQFAECLMDNAWRLTSEPQEDLRPEGVGHWEDEIEDDAFQTAPSFPSH
jgi:hypothetical protein